MERYGHDPERRSVPISKGQAALRVKWGSLPLDLRLMTRKSLLYNKTSSNVLGTTQEIKSLERGSTQPAELRVPLHRNGFMMNWGLGMVVGPSIILS